MSEEDFAILLEYLEGLQGAARKMTVEKAEKIMKDADDTDDVEAGKTKRIPTVLYMVVFLNNFTVNLNLFMPLMLHLGIIHKGRLQSGREGGRSK